MYALQNLFIGLILDIFPSARKMLKNSPAHTAAMVSCIVTTAPRMRAGIQMMTFPRVFMNPVLTSTMVPAMPMYVSDSAVSVFLALIMLKKKNSKLAL
jgi:small basic protein